MLAVVSPRRPRRSRVPAMARSARWAFARYCCAQPHLWAPRTTEVGEMSLRSIAFSLKTATVFRGSLRTAQELAAHDDLSVERLRELSDRRMIQQVRFAMTQTVFYRELYKRAGIALGDITSREVFEFLPIVTKEDVRERGAEFTSTEASENNSRRVATGGSTGEPLIMKRDARVNPRAYEWRLLKWWGLAPYVDTAIVYRFFRDQKGTLKQKAVWWPSKRFQLDAFDMTEEAMRAFLTEYARVKPGLLIGYVGGVLELARFAANEGLRLAGSPVIATTAAPVLWQQREEIEAVFGGRVYDHYRCAELNWIAGECRERDGLHVFEDLKRLELVGPDLKPVASGESGQVVVTDFTNRVFPLIRYQLGDVTSVKSGPCSCGMPYLRIDNVRGRVSDAAVLPDGDVLAGEALAQTFSKVAEAVKQFQIYQHADHSITVKVIPRLAPDDPRIEQAVEAVRKSVRETVPVSLEIVDSLPHEGGKIRFIVSEVGRVNS